MKPRARLTGRRARAVGAVPMPEQDPTVRRLNAEIARERAEHERRLLQHLAAAAAVIAVGGSLLLWQRRRVERPS